MKFKNIKAGQVELDDKLLKKRLAIFRSPEVNLQDILLFEEIPTQRSEVAVHSPLKKRCFKTRHDSLRIQSIYKRYLTTLNTFAYSQYILRTAIS